MNVAEEAIAAVTGPRQQSYGSPAENFQRAINLWNAYLESKYPKAFIRLTIADYTAMMRLLKEARLMNGYHRDSLVDIIGYSLCDEMVQTAPEPALAPVRTVAVPDAFGEDPVFMLKHVDSKYDHPDTFAAREACSICRANNRNGR